jgi:hypothetical protein
MRAEREAEAHELIAPEGVNRQGIARLAADEQRIEILGSDAQAVYGDQSIASG